MAVQQASPFGLSPTARALQISPTNLAQRAAGDIGSAIMAGFMVAPFVAAVDKAIAQVASGQSSSTMQSAGASMRELMSNPVAYVKAPAFRYVWALFAGTYTAANLFTTFEEIKDKSMPLGKTSAIFVANCSLALYKDYKFARLFSDKPPAPIPKPALASWFIRDWVSMGVIFAAPPKVAAHLEDTMGIAKETAQPIVQFGLPIMLQPFVAPFHLYGYVLYNNQTASWAEQKAIMRREIWGAIQMRWCRIVAPFSIGTTLNKAVRNALKPSQ